MPGTAPDFSHERAALDRGAASVAGIDEAGRGPLAGPVVAAAVRLDPARIPDGLNDSKQVSPARRRAIRDRLLEVAEVAVGIAEVAEIDRHNILRATHLSMRRAVSGLSPVPELALVDGNSLPAEMPCQAIGLVKGDTLSLSIAAASIVAKVTRDAIMVDLAQQFPGYGWDHNAGYPTPEHLAALQTLGATPHHRRSFRPVYNILYQDYSARG